MVRTRQGELREGRVNPGDGVQPYPDLGGSLYQHLPKTLPALQNWLGQYICLQKIDDWGSLKNHPAGQLPKEQMAPRAASGPNNFRQFWSQWNAANWALFRANHGSTSSQFLYFRVRHCSCSPRGTSSSWSPRVVVILIQKAAEDLAPRVHEKKTWNV